jgi:UDP-N-acetylmuramoylalanine--D-glutamate ligase
MMNLAKTRVLVIGLRRSGMAAIKLLARHGARINANDQASVAQLGPVLLEASRFTEKIEAGGHKADWFARADLIVVSPGVPLTAKEFDLARKNEVPIVSEIELASWFVDTPILAVTGTDGKSTTTALTGELLQSSGLSVFVGGNIGRPLSELPLSGESYDVAVVELSSFQLEAIHDFHPRATAITNLSLDHQDRYGSFEQYVSAKSNVFSNMGPDDAAILNAADATVVRHYSHLPSPIQWFGDVRKPGAFIAADTLEIRTPKNNLSLGIEAFSLPGPHNRENLMAASLLALAGGATAEGLRKGIASFKGLAHRQENVGESGGILYINDSKATSPGATATALKAAGRPIILLMGGRDKGGDFAQLANLVADKVKLLVVFGEAAESIENALTSATRVVRCMALAEAIRLAHSEAVAGDAIVLSPGCASFDAFKSFEERGNQFKEVVRALR